MNLPSPRSNAYLFEEGTGFEYSIGDGDCIGGSLPGLDHPVYIDWDPEEPTHYTIHYDPRNLEQILNLEPHPLVYHERAYSIEQAQQLLIRLRDRNPG